MLSDDEDSQEQLRAQNVALVRRVLELEQQLALVAQQLAQHRAEAAASVLGNRIKQLEQSEERFRIIAEHSTELISLHDSSGHRLYVAPSVEEVLGYSTDELEKVSNYSLMPQEDRLQGAIAAQRVRSHGHAELSCRLRHRNGSLRWIDAVGYKVPCGEDYYLLWLGRDVTAQRLLEVQLRQAQKMEGIGRLAGSVAHDFNNLLVVIAGCVDLASLALPPGHQVQLDLMEIQQASQRATGLTRQLLTFVRRQPSEPRVLDLNQVLRDLSKLLRRLIRENIELVTTFDQSIGCVRADPGQIEQVIINLAVNAFDAMPRGGRLSIKLSSQVLSETQAAALRVTAGPFVVLSTSDTGTGMTLEVQRHLFEPFYTTKADGRGTGLGLATCNDIVKLHGGAIQIDSEPGSGTRVRVYLPQLDVSTPEAAAPVVLSSLPRGTEHILLVEDEPTVLALSARILREQGYSVQEASRGDVALRMLSPTAPPALLLTDVVMPGMDGRTLARLLRETWPDLRVLFMSGYTDHDPVDSEQLEHRCAFVQKPFTPALLLQTVRALLDSDCINSGRGRLGD